MESSQWSSNVFHWCERLHQIPSLLSHQNAQYHLLEDQMSNITFGSSRKSFVSFFAISSLWGGSITSVSSSTKYE